MVHRSAMLLPPEIGSSRLAARLERLRLMTQLYVGTRPIPKGIGRVIRRFVTAAFQVPSFPDVQACPILTRAHLDRGTPSRFMRHRNTSSRIMGNAAIATKPWPWCFNSKSLIDSVHEPVEQQAFPAGKAASLRVLSSLRTTQKSKIARFPSAGGLELGTHRLWLD